MTSPASPEPNVLAEPSLLKPSGSIRLLWWCLMLAPVGGVLIFLLPVLVLITAGVAFVVAVDSVTDRQLTLPQRAIGLLLAVGVIPATLLGIYVAVSLGFFDDAPTATDRVLTIAATMAWVLSLMAVRQRAWAIMKKNDWKP